MKSYFDFIGRTEVTRGARSRSWTFQKTIWPLGQAVKTPPFHGGNTGSNPVGVIQVQKPRSFKERGFFVYIHGVGMHLLLYLYPLLERFRAMQRFSFYSRSLPHRFTGNAPPLLLPKFTFTLIFGQCSASPFTQIHFHTDYRAMQRLSFYPNSLPHWISGNAAPLLLPKFTSTLIIGQCNVSPFTQIHFHTGFRAMQRLSFYPNSLPYWFTGNAAPLLLPKFTSTLDFGQCSASPFTQIHFHTGLSGNAAPLLLPKFTSTLVYG